MFKGANEFVLNEATLIEAVDYWLKHCIYSSVLEAPKITSIQPNELMQVTTYRVLLRSADEVAG